MIQKSYSEGIYLEKEGPKSSTTFRSSYNFNSEKSYRTAVSLVPKLIPKRTFFTVDGVLPKSPAAVYKRACSLSNGEKSYESGVSLDETDDSSLKREDNLPYYQSIELEPRLVMKDYSETIHNFAKTDSYSYNSSLVYDPCYIKEHYVVGLEVRKVREVTLATTGDGSFTTSMHVALPESGGYEESVVNGKCNYQKLVNGI